MLRKLLYVLLLILVSCSCPAWSADELSTAQVAEKALPAIVTLQTKDKQGSGCFVDSSGTLLTCYHVINGAKSVLAKTTNGSYFPVQGVMGMSPSKDIAVLKVEAKQVPFIRINDSAALRPGDKVIAIGSPMGFENSVSEGVVSSIRLVSELPDECRKELLSIGRSDGDVLIQFTAPISPGSSGGPLLNAEGEVIGIVVMGHQSAANVYLAVPVNEAKPFLSVRTVTKFDEIDLSSIGGEKKISAPQTEDFGLGASVTIQKKLRIPKNAKMKFSIPPGHVANVEDVVIAFKKSGAVMKRVDSDPSPSEYRLLDDGTLSFNRQNSKTEIIISYACRMRRVAIMPALNEGGIRAAGDLLKKGVAHDLTDLGFEVVEDASVRNLVRDEQINIDEAVHYKDGLQPEAAMKIAHQLGAFYIVFGEVYDGSISAESAYPRKVAVAVLMFDGRTGRCLLAKDRNDVIHAGWSLEEFLREMTGSMFKEYFMLE